jgi:hypothetical protein
MQQPWPEWCRSLPRASAPPELPPDNVPTLSPVLLVRGRLDAHVPLTVADGYHRICASYHLDEDADIPCRIVDWPKA